MLNTNSLIPIKCLTLSFMKKSITFLLLIILSNPLWAQKKLIKKLFSNEKDTTRKASFMPVPVFGYAQETGFEFGLGALYSFYIDKSDTTNRSSNFLVNGSYATKKTYNLSTRSSSCLLLNGENKSSVQFDIPDMIYKDDTVEYIQYSIPYCIIPVSF